MSLIEKATKRLAELQRAGVDVPDRLTRADAGTTGTEIPDDTVPTPEAVVRELGAQRAESGLTDEVRAMAGDARDAPIARTGGRVSAPKRRVEVDLARLKAQGFVTPDDSQSQVANEFRVLKRPIIRNAQGRSGAQIRNGKLIMVTSSVPGEGKTFTAANLALSMALEVDNTVLLVDGDVAHPSIPGVLGVPHSPGLLDLLTNEELDVSDVLLATNIENLAVLPAGSRHRRATELLASERMASLLRELTSRYPDRIIVFDSPPLLATTEAPVLATQMGQIVMVVAADETSHKTLKSALATIEQCEVVLMTLNKAAKSDVGIYYGYYAGDVPD